MNAWDAVGYLAAGLVFAAFCMRDILHLRIVGVASNVAFLAYGVALGLTPVWLLHLVLLPVNLVRLWQIGSRIATDKSRVVVQRARVQGRIRTGQAVPPAEPRERSDPVARATQSRRHRGRRLPFLSNARNLRVKPPRYFAR